MKALILIPLLLLTSCVGGFKEISYDTNELFYVTEIQATAENAIDICPLSTSAPTLKELSHKFSIYTKYSSGGSTNKAANELYNLTKELYKKGPITTEFYCKEKLTNILDATNLIGQALGYKEK